MTATPFISVFIFGAALGSDRTNGPLINLLCLCHNCFGCGQEALAVMVEVGVIGAGVIGLSTALNLQRELPGCSVTVMADRFETDTTSDGAAGIVRPSAELLDGLDVRTSRYVCVCGGGGLYAYSS